MTPRFQAPLQVEQLSDSNWRLTQDLVFESAVLGRNIVVPKGFVTDFASVPRLPFAYLVAGGHAEAPAVIHDYLYRRGGSTRAQADAVFREAMAADDQPWWRRNLMWAAVRLFGWSTYPDRTHQGGSQ